MSSKLPYVLIIIGIITLGVSGGVYLFNNRTGTSKQNVAKSSPAPSSAINNSEDATVLKKEQSKLVGYDLVSKNVPFNLTDSVDLLILGSEFQTPEQLNAARTGLSSDVVKPENHGIVVYYKLTNKTNLPQKVFNFKGDETTPPTPFMIFDSSERVDVDNGLMAFTLLAFDQLKPNDSIQSGFIFELPSTFTNLSDLNFVIDYPTFKQKKAYAPLFALTASQ